MKVLYLNNLYTKPKDLGWCPIDIYKRLLRMPCEVHIKTSADVEDLAKECQVVIMGYCNKGLTYGSNLSFLNNLSTLKIQYHIDPWHKMMAAAKLDYVITPCKSMFKRFEPFFWSPVCTDLYTEAPVRDIDIVLWGNVTKRYPLRQFMANQLESLVVKGPDIKEGAYFYTIKLGGKEYTYLRIPLNDYFYSNHLYDLLARSRICVTGTNSKAPHAKYFENAACGVVTITDEFTDMEDLGFKHGKNLWATTEETFLTDLQFLLENPNLVNKMSINSRKLIETKHTIDIRAQELYKFLTDITGVS